MPTNPFSDLEVGNSDEYPRGPRRKKASLTTPIVAVLSLGAIALVGLVILFGVVMTRPGSSEGRKASKPEVVTTPEVKSGRSVPGNDDAKREAKELLAEQRKMAARAAGWRIVKAVPVPDFKGDLFAPGATDRYGRELQLDQNMRQTLAELFALELIDICLREDQRHLEAERDRLLNGQGNAKSVDLDELRAIAKAEGLRAAKAAALPSTPEATVKIHAEKFAEELLILLTKRE